MRSENKNLNIRNNRGISIMLLVVALSTFMLIIDFFVFNLVQMMIVEREVNSICDAASLTGASILLRMDNENDSLSQDKTKRAQKIALRCAENMILRSRILNNSLTRASSVIDESDLRTNLKANECHYIVKINTSKSGTAKNQEGGAAQSVVCSVCYGYRPVFLNFEEKICLPISGQAEGGLPQIDSVIALDLSASMDDQTVVTFVRREWIHSPLGMGTFAMGNVSSNNFNSGASGIIQYVSLACPSSPHTIANYLGWKSDSNAGGGSTDSELVDGSLVNVLPPQNLDKAKDEPHGAITHPLRFDAYLRSHYSHFDKKSNYEVWPATPSPYCRAFDYGTPPGNCDLSVGLGGNGDGATDMMGNVATPLGPGPNVVMGPGMMGKNSFVNPNYRGPMTTVSTNPVPAINAFGDLLWQRDGDDFLGYQPAAPGAAEGLPHNDPIPSPDQQTFTDLVVNIVNPSTAKSGQPLTGPDYFVGFSYTFPNDEPDPLLRNQNFNFPNIAVVVEAARGNLESTPVLPKGVKNSQAALIDRPVSIDGNIFDMRSIEPKDGYQRAYQRLAMLVTQPLASVLDAIDRSYIQKLHKYGDCRFGLVGFSSAGSLSDRSRSTKTFGTFDDKSIPTASARSFYIFCSPYGRPELSNPVFDGGMPMAGGLNDNALKDGSGYGFRVPRIPLDINIENYLECVSKNKLKQQGPNGEMVNVRLNYGDGANGIYNGRAESICDSGEALQTAYDMFHNSNYDISDPKKCRPAANRVILFFTDGEPSGGVIGKEAQTMLRVAGPTSGLALGNSCRTDGIAIFTVALNLNKNAGYEKLKEHQQVLFNDKVADPRQPSGISGLAGHGGRYYACENLTDLKSAFSEIARHYTQGQN